MEWTHRAADGTKQTLHWFKNEPLDSRSSSNSKSSSNSNRYNTTQMTVRCISNTDVGLPASLEKYGYRGGRPLPLTVGKDYVVYGIGFLNSEIWYFIENDDAGSLRYPNREPAQLFTVLEGSIPRCWEFAYTPDHGDHSALMTFSEWTTDRYFYDRLTDGQTREVEIFKRRKRAIDTESSGLSLVTDSEEQL